MLSKIELKRFRRCLLFLFAGFIGLSLVCGAAPAHAQAQKTLIDLNTASQEDIESIKGVGPATAKKIIAGRPYKTLEGLKKAGIPDKTIESMKPYVKVGAAVPAPAKPAVESKPAVQTKPAATEAKPSVPAGKAKTPPKAAGQVPAKPVPGQKVNLNTGTKEQLETLPEIGPVKAQAIIDNRPYKNTEDVMKVKGIKEGTYNKIKDFITVR